ncbi:phage tail protein I [Nonomuraea sediminis]|uniref:phage tail protein I n=1 Tax=Nonomuraea sediminis TaxID=2835864 RepID=UPI001BDC8214|nr:phage tail protein I [Nonomuraea sediminis]
MRGAVTHLASAHPLGEQLPAMFADDLAQNLTQALDEVLAPILTTLDCLDSYLDPALTPSDMLPWLANWVAIGFGEQMTEAQRRALVADAVSLHRGRGTLDALARLVNTLTGVDAQVTDTGGVGWSTRPGGHLPGTDEAKVTIHLPDETEVDRTWLKEVLELGVPAHVSVEVTILNPPGQS